MPGGYASLGDIRDWLQILNLPVEEYESLKKEGRNGSQFYRSPSGFAEEERILAPTNGLH